MGVVGGFLGGVTEPAIAEGYAVLNLVFETYDRQNKANVVYTVTDGTTTETITADSCGRANITVTTGTWTVTLTQSGPYLSGVDPIVVNAENRTSNTVLFYGSNERNVTMSDVPPDQAEGQDGDLWLKVALGKAEAYAKFQGIWYNIGGTDSAMFTVNLYDGATGVTVKAVRRDGKITEVESIGGTAIFSLAPDTSYTISADGYFTQSNVFLPYAGTTITLNKYPHINVTVSDPKQSGAQSGIRVNWSCNGQSGQGVADASGSVSFDIPTTGVCTTSLELIPKTKLSSDDRTIDANGVYNIALPILWSFTLSMNFDSAKFVSDPNNCLSYAGDCAGFTPVSGPGSSGSTPGRCTTIGSWEMKSDGTSGNPLLNACFYATFHDTGAGQVLYEKLNPQNLKEAIALWDDSAKSWTPITPTTSHNTTEITMFCVPTIYVGSTASSISLSDNSANGTAFAHTIDGVTYQYVGISVYPGFNESSKLVSKSGKTSSVSISQANLKTYSKAISVRNGHSFLMNWHVWQLYRLMVLFSMRHFNSQQQIGQGGQNYGAKTTGLMDALGPFAGSSSTSTGDSQGVKAFIENPWGHNYEYLGDVKYVSSAVRVWATSAQAESDAGSGIAINSAPHSLTSPSLASGAISMQAMTWGWGTASGGSKTTGGCDYQGLPASSNPCALVGGNSDNVSNGNAGVSCVISHGGSANSGGGGRSAFIFNP